MNTTEFSASFSSDWLLSVFSTLRIYQPTAYEVWLLHSCQAHHGTYSLMIGTVGAPRSSGGTELV